MTSTIWMNVLLTVPFLLAFIGIPLWLTYRHLDRRPDFAEARAYLAAKRVQVGARQPAPSESRRAA